jgi:hypothetical protein
MPEDNEIREATPAEAAATEAAEVAEDADTPVDDDLGDGEVPFRYSITSYGADYPVDGLIKRIEDGSIYIPPFQRRFVWDLKRGSRFIESLLLGLPVPGIFLSKEQPTQKLLVIDGQQRLRTLQYFYRGIFADSKREFALKGVQDQFENLTYKTLPDEARRRLDDSILHATIVKQEEPSTDESSIYHIFERLNTGGVVLRPQEIRACIYHGSFQEELKRLNENAAWRGIYGKVNPRMKDQELILRFLALYLEGAAYSQPMKGFLNSFMGNNRELNLYPSSGLTAAFVPTIELVSRCLGPTAFKPKTTFNAAVFDSVMVGVARRIERGPVANCEMFSNQYRSLVGDAQFTQATETGTSAEERVNKRIELATAAFQNVE